MERYDGWTAQPNGTRTFAPVTVSTEAMAAAQRSIDYLQRLHETNEARLRALFVQPSVFVGPIKFTSDPTLKPGEFQIKGGSYGLASGVALDPGPEFLREYLGEWREPDPIDPLDVEHDGVKLRQLLSHDEMWRKEGWPDAWVAKGYNKPTPDQRAAVSAHWSAQLRAKVAASAAADKARETSVVVDLEEP